MTIGNMRGNSVGTQSTDHMLTLNRASKNRPSGEWSADDYDVFDGEQLCVPKTLSALINRMNRPTSAHYDRAAVFRNGRLGRAVQVEEPA